MTDKQKIDKDFITSVVNMERHDAESWMDSELSEAQAKNLDYYNGEEFGNEEEGFSQVVTRDVLETVEGIMPDLMKIFTAGDEVVAFDPAYPGDEENVQLEGAYMNHLFYNRYDGYTCLYTWFKDALLMKNSYVMTDYCMKEQVQFTTYEGLTEEEFKVLEDGQSDDENLEGTEWELDSYEPNPANEELYDARVRLTRWQGVPEFTNIPSEEFLIKDRSVCIKDAAFVAWTPTKTRGELIEMGFDEDDLENAAPSSNSNADKPVQRARWNDPREDSAGAESISGYMNQELDYMEAWTRMYCEEEERVKLIHSFHVGMECLDYEEVDRCPIISITPFMTPHKHIGVCPADLVTDIQEIHSMIMRQMLDNLALQNAGRYTAVEGQVNYQDLIDNRIGGVIRQKMAGAVQRLDTPDLSNFTIPVLEQLQLHKENRTGVSRMTAGLDDKALNSHQSMGAVTTMMSAAQNKILLIARNFAETGVKQLFKELRTLIREHQQSPDMIQVGGRFAIVNPAEWQDRNDIKVTVGLGRGNKDQQLVHLQAIQGLLSSVQNSPAGYLIQPEHTYALVTEFIKNSGFEDPTKFIAHPSQVQPPEPAPDPQLIAAQAQQVASQAQMVKAQTDQAKEQHRQMKEFPWEQKTDAAELGLEATQDRAVGIGDGK